MEDDSCHLCGGALQREGFDDSGYWRVFRCEDCETEVQRPATGDMDGISPADLNNISEFNDAENSSD